MTRAQMAPAVILSFCFVVVSCIQVPKMLIGFVGLGYRTLNSDTARETSNACSLYLQRTIR